jgi:hypothetical protein
MENRINVQKEVNEATTIFFAKDFQDLPPVASGKKSNYGKAFMAHNVSFGRILYSYNTPICATTGNGLFVKIWNGYSYTTARHINDFIAFERLTCSGLNKKQWENMKPWHLYSLSGNVVVEVK